MAINLKYHCLLTRLGCSKTLEEGEEGRGKTVFLAMGWNG